MVSSARASWNALRCTRSSPEQAADCCADKKRVSAPQSGHPAQRAAPRALSNPKPSPSLNAASPGGKLRIKPARKSSVCISRRTRGVRQDAWQRRTSEREQALETHGVVRVFARQRQQPLHHAAVQQLLLRLGVVLRRGGQHLRRRRAQRRMRAAQHCQKRVQAANLGQVACAVNVLHVVLQLLCAVTGAGGGAGGVSARGQRVMKRLTARPAPRKRLAAAHRAAPRCALAAPRSARPQRQP